MGTVYKASHTKIPNRIAAIKVLKSNFLQNENLKNRFRREMEIMATISHENIIKLEQFDEAQKILSNLCIKQPEYLPTYYRLGQILEQLKNPEAAIETYQMGLKLAKSKKDFKAAGELTEALMLLDVFDE